LSFAASTSLRPSFAASLFEFRGHRFLLADNVIVFVEKNVQDPCEFAAVHQILHTRLLGSKEAWAEDD
jgi:hypothetical protein